MARSGRGQGPAPHRCGGQGGRGGDPPPGPPSSPPRPPTLAVAHAYVCVPRSGGSRPCRRVPGRGRRVAGPAPPRRHNQRPARPPLRPICGRPGAHPRRRHSPNRCPPSCLHTLPHGPAQIPKGWDATRLGVPPDLARTVDPVTLYALVSTVEALQGAGITDPYEFYEVSSTPQGPRPAPRPPCALTLTRTLSFAPSTCT